MKRVNPSIDWSARIMRIPVSARRSVHVALTPFSRGSDIRSHAVTVDLTRDSMTWQIPRGASSSSSCQKGEIAATDVVV